MPGFNEGQRHIHDSGAHKPELNVKDWDEIVAMVAEAVKKQSPVIDRWPRLAPGKNGILHLQKLFRLSLS